MGVFNPRDYDTVESRLAKFWADHPQGRVLTQLVHHTDGQYIVRAEVYADRDDTRPVATGHAEEHVAARGVNQTWALENCETSAIGRALADFVFAAKSRPSVTEMEKAHRQNGQPAGPPIAREALEELAAVCTAMGYDRDLVAALYAAEHDGANLRAETDAARLRAFVEHLDEVDPTRIKAPVANGASA